jgi:predicted transcriptional regulator
LEQLAELLFLLASVDRLTLLFEIHSEKYRLSHLAAKLSATQQETSKHLKRLRDAKLIEKDSDGFFRLTVLGCTILRLLPSLKFIFQNRNYFLSHDISSLPLEFIERIGELEHFEHDERVGFVLAYTQRIVHDAEEYIWLMADHPLGREEYVGGKKLETSNSVRWRVIVPEGTNVDWASLRSSIGDHMGRIEYAFVSGPNDIHAGIALNEKIAGLTFPDITGRLDFNSGFRGSDPLFHKWCQDLFVFHWNKTKKRIRI